MRFWTWKFCDFLKKGKYCIMSFWTWKFCAFLKTGKYCIMRFWTEILRFLGIDENCIIFFWHAYFAPNGGRKQTAGAAAKFTMAASAANFEQRHFSLLVASTKAKFKQRAAH